MVRNRCGSKHPQRSCLRATPHPCALPFPAAPRDPSHSLWGTTKRQRKAALQQALQEQYGPHAGDRDVRLYLQKRGLNEARHPRGTRRGGLPLDDSFDKPGTFLKLSPAFQRTVCECHT